MAGWAAFLKMHMQSLHQNPISFPYVKSIVVYRHLMLYSDIITVKLVQYQCTILDQLKIA